MKRVSAMWFAVFAVCYVVTNYAEATWPSPSLSHVLSLFGLLALICGLLSLTLRQALLPLAIIAASLSVGTLHSGLAGIGMAWQGFTVMRGMVTVILVVPMISWALKSEPYIQYLILHWSRLLNTSVKFYSAVMIVAQLIGCFLLVASIPVTYQFISGFLSGERDRHWDFLKSAAVLRGFSLLSLWSITNPSFAFAVEMLGVPVARAMGNGFVLAALGLLLAIGMFAVFERRGNDRLTEEINRHLAREAAARDAAEIRRKYYEFLVLLITLLGGIALVNSITTWGLLTVMPLTVIVWTTGYFAIKRKLPLFAAETAAYFKGGMLGRAREICIFLAAGMFISEIQGTGIAHAAVATMYQLTSDTAWLNFLLIMPCAVVCFSLMGMPPLASSVLVLGIVQVIALPYPPELTFIAVTLGVACCILISPINVPGLLLSAENGYSSYINTFKLNKWYVLALFALVELIIQCVWLF